MKWISKIVFISLYFLPLVLLFEYITPFSSRTRIPEASAFMLAIGILNIIALRYVTTINANTRLLVCVVSITVYDYILLHLLIDKYAQVLGGDGYLYFMVLASLNIGFFGIFKSYFVPIYGDIDALVKKIWRGKLRSDYVVMSTAVNLTVGFIFTLWLGNILNDNSSMKFFHYFVYGRDKTFNLNAWFIQPPMILSIAIYIALLVRAFTSSSQKTNS